MTLNSDFKILGCVRAPINNQNWRSLLFLFSRVENSVTHEEVIGVIF